MDTTTRLEQHGDRLILCYPQRPAHLCAMLQASLNARADAPALIDGEQQYTWETLSRLSLSAAAYLHSLGVQAGDRVGLLLGNSAGFVLATHAVLQLGAVLVPISTREAAPGVDFILKQCEAKAVITDHRLLHLLPQSATLLTWLLPDDLHSLDPIAPITPIAPAQAHEDDAAVILYTSGTTGQPKGAVLTHLNLIHSVLHYQHVLGLHAQDRALLAVPGSHVTGLVAIILAMAGVGGCVVVLREFKAAACVQQVVTHRVTYSLMVPAMYALCLREPALANADLSAWRLAGFGGAPMPPSTIEGLHTHCPGIRLFNAYGATETTSPATITPTGSTRVEMVGVGVPVPCGDIRVMDAQGVEVPRGTPGEVWIAGPMVVPRYWNNPAATAQGFVAGYWKSGDIGTLDEHGFLQVHDRQKDMINRGGYKVFSVEVENCLVGHQDVLEAATVGVPCPVLGERTHAFVVAPTCTDTTALQAALKARCQAELADYKTPDAWTFLTQPLPRNANGKVLKRQLRERAL